MNACTDMRRPRGAVGERRPGVSRSARSLRLARAWGVMALLAWFGVAVNIAGGREPAPLFAANLALALAAGPYSALKAAHSAVPGRYLWMTVGFLPLAILSALAFFALFVETIVLNGFRLF